MRGAQKMSKVFTRFKGEERIQMPLYPFSKEGYLQKRKLGGEGSC